MSFQIAKVKGIPVRLHFTLIIVFFLIAWTLASSFMPQYFPNLATVQYWIMGAIGAIILFISVRQHLTAEEIMIPLEDLVVMLPSRSADEALMKMTRTRMGKVFVCDPQGILLGLVSKTDIMNMASERQEFQQELKKLCCK